MSRVPSVDLCYIVPSWCTCTDMLEAFKPISGMVMTRRLEAWVPTHASSPRLNHLPQGMGAPKASAFGRSAIWGIPEIEVSRPATENTLNRIKRVSPLCFLAYPIRLHSLYTSTTLRMFSKLDFETPDFLTELNSFVVAGEIFEKIKFLCWLLSKLVCKMDHILL